MCRRISSSVQVKLAYFLTFFSCFVLFQLNKPFSVIRFTFSQSCCFLSHINAGCLLSSFLIRRLLCRDVSASQTLPTRVGCSAFSFRGRHSDTASAEQQERFLHRIPFLTRLTRAWVRHRETRSWVPLWLYI